MTISLSHHSDYVPLDQPLTEDTVKSNLEWWALVNRDHPRLTQAIAQVLGTPEPAEADTALRITRAATAVGINKAGLREALGWRRCPSAERSSTEGVMTGAMTVTLEQLRAAQHASPFPDNALGECESTITVHGAIPVGADLTETFNWAGMQPRQEGNVVYALSEYGPDTEAIEALSLVHPALVVHVSWTTPAEPCYGSLYYVDGRSVWSDEVDLMETAEYVAYQKLHEAWDENPAGPEPAFLYEVPTSHRFNRTLADEFLGR